MAEWNMFDVVNSVNLKFPADVCNFPTVVFSFEKHSNVNFGMFWKNFFVVLKI